MSLRQPWRAADEQLRAVGDEPDYRFSLANERTFLAYLRTALALFAAGVAVLALDVFGDGVFHSLLGASLLGLGILASATSYHRWRVVEEAIRRAEPLPLSLVPRILSLALTVTAVATLVAALIA
jgi:putative membrane protein